MCQLDPGGFWKKSRFSFFLQRFGVVNPRTCNWKLLEIEKDIVREVDRGDKPYLRKSTDRKAQIRKAFVQFSGLICASGSLSTRLHLTHALFFYFE